MPDNFTLNPEDINNAARNVYQVMSEADDAILQAQNAIKNTMGIAGSIPANAKYAGSIEHVLWHRAILLSRIT